MRKFHFYGHLAEVFPEPVEMEVDTALEGIRALAMQVEPFLTELEKGDYRVIRGDRDTGIDLDLEAVVTFHLGQGDVHIVPVIEGSGGGGGSGGSSGSWIKIIAGAALVGAAIFFSGGILGAAVPGTFGMLSWGTVAFVGVALALYGAYQLLAKPDDEKDQQENYSINGPTNTYTQGGPVPLIYGEVMAGTVTISAGTEYGQVASSLPNYAIVTYNWTSIDGRDLDTSTRIIAPFVSNYAGWGPGVSSIASPMSVVGYWYSGDNTTNTGPELLSFDLAAIRAQYPSASDLKIELNGNWFAFRDQGNTVVQVATYSGGTLDPYTLNPTTTGSLLGLSSFTKNVTSYGANTNIGTPVGTVTISLSTGEISVVSP